MFLMYFTWKASDLGLISYSHLDKHLTIRTKMGNLELEKMTKSVNESWVIPICIWDWNQYLCFSVTSQEEFVYLVSINGKLASFWCSLMATLGETFKTFYFYIFNLSITIFNGCNSIRACCKNSISASTIRQPLEVWLLSHLVMITGTLCRNLLQLAHFQYHKSYFNFYN